MQHLHLAEVDRQIKQTPIDDWKTYLKWHTLRSASPSLSEPFVKENFAFFQQYLNGDGATLKTWKEMRLAADHPNYRDLKIAADGSQTCRGELIRHRTLTGICNDIRNPAMGSTGQLFARNVEFESTFPDLARDPYAKNRHGGRIVIAPPSRRAAASLQVADGAICIEDVEVGTPLL